MPPEKLNIRLSLKHLNSEKQVLQLSYRLVCILYRLPNWSLHPHFSCYGDPNKFYPEIHFSQMPMHQAKQAGRLTSNALALNILTLQAATKSYSSTHHTLFQHFQNCNSIRLRKKYSMLWYFLYLSHQQEESLQKIKNKELKVRNSPDIHFITLLFTSKP